jgi:hypothetical protein
MTVGSPVGGASVCDDSTGESFTVLLRKNSDARAASVLWWPGNSAKGGSGGLALATVSCAVALLICAHGWVGHSLSPLMCPGFQVVCRQLGFNGGTCSTPSEVSSGSSSGARHAAAGSLYAHPRCCPCKANPPPGPHCGCYLHCCYHCY